MELAVALEASLLGQAMRRSAVLYPAANVGHILAMLVFFASVAIMDVRLIGALPAVSWRRVIGACRPVTVAAFAAQAVTGFLLLAADAEAIIANVAFQLKLVVIVLALVNVAIVEVLTRRTAQPFVEADPAIRRAVRVCALLSLTAWLGVAALGRLIAYV